MAESHQHSFSLPFRRKSLPMRSRPATSHLALAEFPTNPEFNAIRPSTRDGPSHDVLDWNSFSRIQNRQSACVEEPVYHDPFSEATLASASEPFVEHVRRHSTLAQSFKSGFSAIGRRMSFSIRGGKSRNNEEEVAELRKPQPTLYKRRSQLPDLSEAASSRPKTRGLLNSLAGRRRPSMPTLSFFQDPRQLQLQPEFYERDEAPSNTNRLAPVLSDYVSGGAGARASAAAQNEAMLAMRETPLPTYYAATSFGSDIKDSESGIGISVDDERRESASTHVARCDPADYLATELLEQVFSYLDAKSLVQANLVSRNWAGLSRSQVVWREVFYREYAVTLPARLSSRPSIPGMGKNISGQDFRKLYTVRKLIEERWQAGEAAAIYLNGHKDSVYCVQFDEDKIVTGSRDNTVRIWDARTYQCIRKLGPPVNPRERLQAHRLEVEPSGVVPIFKSETSSPEPKNVPLEMWHDKSVLCLQYDEEILVTGSSDFTCIVWSIKEGYKPLFRLVGHAAGVLDVCVDAKHIITCSKDTKIKIWDRFTGQLLRTLSGHRGPVNAVQVRGNLLASASGDGMSKLWRLEDGMCIKEFHSRERGLACVEFSEDGRTIFAGGNDHVIYEYSTITGNIERQLEGHTDLVRSLHLDSANGRIISGSYDHSIKVWDSRVGRNTEDGGLKINLEGWTSSWMLAAKSNYRKIVCASQDGRVVIVDFGYGIDGVHLVEA